MQKFQCFDCSKTVKFLDSFIRSNEFEILTDHDRQWVGFHYLVNGRATRAIVCGECYDVREGLDYDMLGFQTVLEETNKHAHIQDEFPEMMHPSRKAPPVSP
jgi:hypothetical protein